VREEGPGGRGRFRIRAVTTEDLLAAVLKLPLEQRAALADRLLRSLDELPEPERKKLWLDVSERRLQEMREGKVREIPADEVFARGRALTSK
jgi:putative addiction module component (TIGR02574 family)